MKTKISILILNIALAITACKKNDTGGQAEVAAFAKHHDKIIPFAKVYIKYGAKEFPGEELSKYDDSKLTDKEGHVHFENLRYGNYYFYGVGYDSAIQMPVRGGISLKIKWSERKKDINLNVPVTE
jgi:hypothetical protein